MDPRRLPRIGPRPLALALIALATACTPPASATPVDAPARPTASVAATAEADEAGAGDAGRRSVGTLTPVASQPAGQPPQIFPWVARAPVPAARATVTPTAAPAVAAGSDAAPSGLEVAPASGAVEHRAARLALLDRAEGYAADVTGGLDGPLILVTSLADAGPGSLREALESPGPAWVAFAVDGAIRLRSPIAVQSDKTVDGRGRRIEILHRGLDISRAQNVVVTNLILRDGKGDAVSVWHDSRRVWLDHLSLDDFSDGLVDVTREATDVTLSWSRLSNQVKGMLLGAHDWDERAAVIRVSMHHNYFLNVQRRIPKLRYGRAHVYNNLVERWRGPAAEVGFGGQLRLEGNVYRPDPVKSKAVVELDPDGPGLVGGGGNDLGGMPPLPLEAVFVPEYAHGLEPASEALAERLRAETGWQPAPWPFAPAAGQGD